MNHLSKIVQLSCLYIAHSLFALMYSRNTFRAIAVNILSGPSIAAPIPNQPMGLIPLLTAINLVTG